MAISQDCYDMLIEEDKFSLSLKFIAQNFLHSSFYHYLSVTWQAIDFLVFV